MGNTYAKDQKMDNITSDQIKSNIKKVFLNKDNDSPIFSDTIGWQKNQSGGKNFVTIKRYEQFRTSHFLTGGNLGNNIDQNSLRTNLNAINIPSEALAEISSTNITQFGNLNDFYNNQQPDQNKQYFNDIKEQSFNNRFVPTNQNLNTTNNSDGNITEIEQLKKIIKQFNNSNIEPNNSSPNLINFGNKPNNLTPAMNGQQPINTEKVMQYQSQNNNTLSQDSQIEELKRLIKSQIGGGCSCSAGYAMSPTQQIGGGCGCNATEYVISPVSQPINLSMLKGGAKNDNSEKNNKKDNKNKSDKSDKSDKTDNETDEDEMYDEYEEEEDDEEIEEEEEEDDDDDEESSMGRMTVDEISESANPNGKVINAVPFYSSDESISASTYFKHLNRNKF